MSGDADVVWPQDGRTREGRSGVDRILGRFGGLVIAGLGFIITRFFVAETVSLSGAPLAAVATVGSLVIGLGTVIAGVGMLDATLGTQILAANVLLAGAIGGMVNGHRKASLRRRQETIMRGANRARFINRLLRHEVLNAATIMDGHAELLRDADDGDRDRSVDAIRRGASRIESTIHGVGTIAEERDGGMIDPSAAIRSAVDTVDTDLVDVDSGTEDVNVAADDRLSTAFTRLIEHAIDVRDAEHVRIETTTDRHTVSVSVVDDGIPLPSSQRDVLERGAFPEYDDPTSGFDLQAVNLLVGDYDGRIRVDERPKAVEDGSTEGTDGSLTRVTVTLPRASADAATATVGVPYPDLRRATVAGIVAGIAMGALYWLTSGVLPVIGALYGVESGFIGWITHLFHSVVFALLFVAGGSTSALENRLDGLLRSVIAGLSLGVGLWFIAAGLVMPVWLRAVGVPAVLPNLPLIGLVAHGVWGVTLGYVYAILGGRFD